MYSLNPTMTEMLTKQRVSELSSQMSVSRRRLPAGQELPETATLPRLRSVRKAAGWALVEIGLRLAVPRRGTAPVVSAVPRGTTVPGPVTLRRGALSETTT